MNENFNDMINEVFGNMTDQNISENKTSEMPEISPVTPVIKNTVKMQEYLKKGENTLIGTAYLERYPYHMFEDLGMNISSSVYFEYDYATERLELWMVNSKNHQETSYVFEKDTIVKDERVKILRKKIKKIVKEILEQDRRETSSVA